MANSVHAMISILKQQELEIEEVIATIHENIVQQRSDLRFCLPELKEALRGLLQEHCSDTKHLADKLGEDHPVASLWEQKEYQMIDVANEALYLIGIILRNDEELWESDETEASEQHPADAEPATEVKSDAEYCQAASEPKAATYFKPPKAQVQVSLGNFIDTADYLPGLSLFGLHGVLSPNNCRAAIL